MTEEPPQADRSAAATRRLQAAAVLRKNGRSDEAVGEARRAGEIAHQAGDERNLAVAENLIAEIEWERGRWDLASRLFGAAREHAQAAGDEALLLLVESNDAAVYTDLGQLDLARDSLAVALPRLRALDDHPAGWRILYNLGRALAADDQMMAADGLLSRAMSLAKRGADYRQGASLAIARARLALAHRDALRADAHLGTVAVLIERVHDEGLLADAACLEGEAARVGGHPETAERCLREAIERARAADAGGVVARACRSLAELLQEQGKTAEAIEALEAARLQLVALGARVRAAEAGARIATLKARAQ